MGRKVFVHRLSHSGAENSRAGEYIARKRRIHIGTVHIAFIVIGKVVEDQVIVDELMLGDIVAQALKEHSSSVGLAARLVVILNDYRDAFDLMRSLLYGRRRSSPGRRLLSFLSITVVGKLREGNGGNDYSQHDHH